jgi:uncharacterized protein (TIGR03435 family)
MFRLAGEVILILAIAGAAFGQNPATLPSFEAADVHVSTQSVNSLKSVGAIRNGRYEIKNLTMMDLISLAYGVDQEKIQGGPSWLASDRFEIVAKVPSGTTNATAKLMLRSLLAERFNLAIHNEDKPLPVYAMISTGKRGPQLKEASGSGGGCRTPPQSSAPGEIPYNVLSCRNMTMEDIASLIRRVGPGYLNKPVVDMTGLKGSWDMDLKWTEWPLLGSAGSNGISLFGGLEKQLGLKLEQRQYPLPVTVVDRVNQKPTDNAPDVVQKLPPPPPAEFEVADIKPSVPGRPQKGGFQPGGRLDLQSFSLKNLVMLAWSVGDDMVAGPTWIETERFDIVAKAPVEGGTGNPDVDTLRLMLRKLLIDRFKIVMHTENQPRPVYALMTDKREPKLKKADPSNRTDCSRVGAPNVNSAPMVTMTCLNMTLGQLVERLRGYAPNYLDHPVVDLTGLQGAWDFTASWTPRPAFDASAKPGAAPDGSITIFEAFDKQLSLKLEASKQPMPVLVIDKAEQRPIEN